MRLVVLLGVVLAFAAAASALADDSASSAPAQQASPNFDLNPATLPSTRGPALVAKSTPNGSIFSGIDLGGSTLNFQGDRKPPDTRVGAETFEPGTLVQSQKARGIGPSFFGLSIKKSLE